MAKLDSDAVYRNTPYSKNIVADAKAGKLVMNDGNTIKPTTLNIGLSKEIKIASLTATELSKLCGPGNNYKNTDFYFGIGTNPDHSTYKTKPLFGTNGIDKESIKYDLNLKELIVEGLDNLPDDEIKVGDEFVIKMRWPSALDLIKGNDEQVTDLELVSDCIHSIVTEEEETLVENVEKEELEDFINDLPVDAFEKMRKFIHGMPVLQHTVEYACPKCEKEQLVGINGYEHFFG